MIRKLNVTLFFLFIIFIATAQTSKVIQNYIKTYRAIAIQEMQRSGVPAAITLAQGIHETMAGQSDLVQKSNNHFGIKCKEGYSGPYVLHDDDRRNERFMKYDSPEQSYMDHSNFLKDRSRYAQLFQLAPTDYRSWAYGLKRAGYATNPYYANIIIKLIEDYNLQDYSLIALGKKDMPDDMKEYFAGRNIEKKEIAPDPIVPKYPETEFRINDTKVVFVKKGTAYSEVAQKYNIPLQWLISFNDVNNATDVTLKDQLVFLQLKRTFSKNEMHEVKDGESIYDVAQTEGIRLESLLIYNHLTKFASPAIGSVLYLQERTNKIALN
jgi:uncharacterized FlgJ-related protein